MASTVDLELLDTARQLRIAVISLARRLRAERQETGVSPLGISVLIRVRREPRLTPKALARAENVAPQTLTRVLASLEHQGLLSRRPDPSDGRQSLLELTTAGRKLLRRDSARREAWLAGAMQEALAPSERQMLRVVAPLLEILAEYKPADDR
ncbi:MarR family winged helix-turn-helix transcriptional regulator [Rugosimonospora africana]|uniref:MarR family transcriptional regulator n=1 Tax=Rugosimonospora africana TaxID=556532 RepID=A0A8J3VM37_9ACTN|nr:MarR family transcriptional regulator [Rugosimonospora africana]GIH11904.1 MarR family transcriptional regulator [Rugosimonospora africana]